MILDRALFMVGIAVAPVLWMPLNERYGRQKPLYLGLLGYAIMQIPVGVARDVHAIFVCRLFAGMFGCAVIVTVVGSLCDLWMSADRGAAMAIYAAAMIAGPAAGPFVGGFVTASMKLGWSWTSYIILIICGFSGLLLLVCHSETSATVLLHRRAKKQRRLTEDWTHEAALEEGGKLAWARFFDEQVARPLAMLFTEWILSLITIHMSFAYALLYFVVEIFPISYVQERGWSVPTAGLSFLSIVVGALVGCVISYLFKAIRQDSKMLKHGYVSPEERLLPMMVGGIALPLGLLVYGWTSDPAFSVWVSLSAGVPLGTGE
jgi:MFS family permease